MSSDRNIVRQWVEQGVLPYDQLPKALAAAKITPNQAEWHTFIDKLLLATGILSLGCGIIFFFAFNWQELGRIAKFALLEAFILIPALLYLRLKSDSAGAKACLLFASLMLGALIAFFGQTYQTGADPWQLFFYWAMLIIPWVVISRFSALFMLWIALLNISLLLYLDLYLSSFGAWFAHDTSLWLIIFVINTLFLIVWELLGQHDNAYAVRWGPRVLALVSGSCLTTITCFYLVDLRLESAHTLFTYPLWLFVMYYIYRRRNKDMFMLTGLGVSLLVIIATGASMLTINGLNLFVDGFFIIGILLLILTVKMANILKRIHQEDM